MYQAKSLKYNYDALEPNISSKTMDIHYNKHYLGYLNKLNNLLNSINYDYRYDVKDLIKHIDEFPIDIRDDILFYAGGVINHELYFDNLNFSPLSGSLKEAIINKYGSVENFEKEFIKAANNLVGSGYTFLVVNRQKELGIINTSNQETPYLYEMTPIMALDLWEHAYYLDYLNNRNQYILNFFNIINYSKVNENYEKALKSKES